MEALAVAAGEAALSAAFDAIFGKLSSSDVLKYARRRNVESEVNHWHKFLQKLKSVLDDAEERQMSEVAVKIWLDDLRHLAYDVEDVLDEFSTEVLRRKVMVESKARTSQVRKLINTHCFRLSPRNIKFNVSLGSKMQEITARLERITKEKGDLGLTESTTGGSSRTVGKRIQTTSVHESQVYGRENDKEAVIDKLLSCESSTVESVSVVAIVGMGGLGKTTLAQLVYNNNMVRRSFEAKAWVCVSEEFDVLKISVKILEGFTSSPCNSKDLNNVQEKLRDVIRGKKFLLILDDVWNENYLEWDALREPLAGGGFGSQVLVTSRSEKVASTAGARFMHRLGKLGNGECLSLLARHAVAANDFSEHPWLREIGEKIVEKCDGLPLAAKAIGGLLRGKSKESEWLKVLKSNMWELPQDRCPILPALRVSYHYLPSHLKRCFAYCAIFPKDYEFSKEDLIMWWMAEGLLEQSKIVLSNFMEAGNEYFEDLLSMSFFQPVIYYRGESKFIMHDLITDLAWWIAQGICLHLSFENVDGNSSVRFENLRHLSFVGREWEVMKRFEKFSKYKRLRSFIAFQSNYPSFLSNVVLDKVIPKMRFSKVLCLRHYFIEKLPDSIGELKYLRYLDMSYTRIKLLPESLCDLINLLTLKLNGCTNLIQLSQGMKKLINLIILDIDDTEELKVMPSEIGCLTNLQILTKFIVDGNRGLRLKELNELSLLYGKLSIWGLEKVVEIQDGRDANLKGKTGLVSLEFIWTLGKSSALEKEKHFGVLDELQPHTNLKILEIKGYDGERFPKWVGRPSFIKLETLILRDCKSASLLPQLGGLISLKYLEIVRMHGVKRVGKEFLRNTSKLEKIFPSLETLILREMNALEEWCSCSGSGEEAGVEFPRLQKLVLRDCPLLVDKLPNQLPSLRELRIVNCPNLNLEWRHHSLHELVVKDCSESALRTLGNLTSLVRLELRDVRGLVYVDEGLISMLGALQVLEIRRCRNLKALWKNGKEIERMVGIISLVVEDCDEIESLVAAGETGLHCIPSLESLKIRRCCKLVNFGAIRLPISLKKLEIDDCEALESLPEGFMMHGSNNSEFGLEELSIRLCPSLATFPGERFPGKLVSLAILQCRNLESLTKLSNSIKTLKIGSLTNGNLKIGKENMAPISPDVDHNNIQSFPSSLEILNIDGFEEMESLPEKLFIDCSSSLGSLEITNCLNLTRLTENSTAFHRLRDLTFRDCRNLRGLPKQMQDHLPFLQNLRIYNCPNLELLAGEDLPGRLTILYIGGCEKVIQPLFEWGLYPLTSLTYLGLEGGGSFVFNMKNEEPVFLPKLQSLEVKNFKNLESLAAAFRLPSTLERLWIENCGELRELPKDELGSNLGYLRIKRCPLLEKRFLDWKGEYQPLISVIPCVLINDEPRSIELDTFNLLFCLF